MQAGGNREAANGTDAAASRAARSLPASKTALVISSTNSGMPSVRSMMSRRTLSGSVIAGDPIDQRASIGYRQPVEGEHRHLRLPNPGRRVFRPKGHDEQDAKPGDAVDRSSERFQARGVAPMRVLEDHQHRTLPGERLDLREQRIESSLAALFRRQRQDRIPPVIGEREHFGEQPGVLGRGRALREQRIELVEFRARASSSRAVRRPVPFGR